MEITETLIFILAFSSKPIHIPVTAVSLLWALPICLAIATVYKAVNIESFTPKEYIKEVIILFIFIITTMALIAGGLLVLMKASHLLT